MALRPRPGPDVQLIVEPAGRNTAAAIARRE
jgi:mannose-1-phosphate guanylyltransferase